MNKDIILIIIYLVVFLSIIYQGYKEYLNTNIQKKEDRPYIEKKVREYIKE